MKPKINRAGDPKKSQTLDRCQTPAYALDSLLPFIRPDWIVWEPAQGSGRMVRALTPHVRQVVASDILTGQNFFDNQPPAFDAIVTNPPYSIKYQWLKRCYELGKPFALLVPVETIGAEQAQRLMKRHGAELLLQSPRVNFEMPIKGEDGKGAQFPTLWLCWKILPEPIMYGRITPRHDQQVHFLGVTA